MKDTIHRAWWAVALQGGRGIRRDELVALLGETAEVEPVIAKMVKAGYLWEYDYGRKLRVGKRLRPEMSREGTVLG